jgi:hypothetical protein
MAKICLFLLLTSLAFGQKVEPKKVLFIGNSLTSYNEMTFTLGKMFNESGYGARVFESTLPGVWLRFHYDLINSSEEVAVCKNCTNDETNAILIKFNEKEHWDWVILQEASALMLIPSERQLKFESYAIKLDSLIKKTGGKGILFLPYTISENYPKKYCCPALNDEEKQICKDDICCSDNVIIWQPAIEIVFQRQVLNFETD